MNCTHFEKTDPSKRARRRVRPLFDLTQAEATLPLVRSILKEVVERSIRISHHELEIKRENGKSGENPRTKRLFAIRDFSKSERQEQLQAIEELGRLGLTVLDKVRGSVGFPTIVNGSLAYFVFELGESKLQTWRYRDESIARPIPAEWHVKSNRRLEARLEV